MDALDHVLAMVGYYRSKLEDGRLTGSEAAVYLKCLVDSEQLVARLKSKRIWGLESRDEESEIAAHHEAVANTIVRGCGDLA
jgi:hypothetical protein